MSTQHDDLYGVFVRTFPDDRDPDGIEVAVRTCFTYSEARRIQRLLQPGVRDCVIRYLGTAGGGD
jgi:hypothetical protein